MQRKRKTLERLGISPGFSESLLDIKAKERFVMQQFVYNLNKYVLFLSKQKIYYLLQQYNTTDFIDIDGSGHSQMALEHFKTCFTEIHG